MSPPAMRSRVDLPRPRASEKAENLPFARRDSRYLDSTGSGSPEGLAKALQTLRSSMIGVDTFRHVVHGVPQSSRVRRSAKA